MTDINAMLLLSIAIWFVYSAYVIRLIVRARAYEQPKLRYQIVLACCVPFVGAGLVHFMFYAMVAKEPTTDPNHVPSRCEPDSDLSRVHIRADE